MNRLAIAIQYNQKRIFVGAQWPTMQTLKSTAWLKLARLKYKAREVALGMVMALIPLPRLAVA